MTPDEAREVIEHDYVHNEPSTALIYAANATLAQLDEARADLARRDATIAAQRPVIDAATAWVRHMEGSRDACMGTAAALIAAVDTYRAALSAPVEAGTPTEPARKPCPGSGSQVISAKGYTRMWCAVCEADVGPWSWESPWPAAPEHYREEAGTPAAEPANATTECDECGHPRADHPNDQACRAVLRPLWAPDDECWCGRYVAALAGPADDTTREAQP